MKKIKEFLRSRNDISVVLDYLSLSGGEWFIEGDIDRHGKIRVYTVSESLTEKDLKRMLQHMTVGSTKRGTWPVDVKILRTKEELPHSYKLSEVLQEVL